MLLTAPAPTWEGTSATLIFLRILDVVVVEDVEMAVASHISFPLPPTPNVLCAKSASKSVIQQPNAITALTIPIKVNLPTLLPSSPLSKCHLTSHGTLILAPQIISPMNSLISTSMQMSIMGLTRSE